jgi:hypothetical protein
MMKDPGRCLFIRLIILGTLVCGPLYISAAQEAAAAQEVDREELEKNQAPVIFINYEGTPSRIETRQQIVNIGYSPGLAVRNGVQRYGPLSRYFVIHSVSPKDGDKLDADIFGLGVDIGVDHIRNLRFIVQGYLQGAYGYSLSDAALLAEYITIYNAVFRGTWDYFTSRYKTPVIQELTPEKAGLSIRFDEWPGRTLMVIPLGTGKPGLSAVDTSSLTAPAVISEMRREEDRGIEQRKDMVDLKEREANEAEQSAALQREAIAQEEARIAQERAAVAQERAAVAQERQQAQPAAQGGVQAQERPQQAQPAAQDGVQAQESSVQGGGQTLAAAPTETGTPPRSAEAELASREAEADRKEAELDQREAALEQQRIEAAAAEAFAEQKTAETRQEREEIARDQQELIDQAPPAPSAEGIIGVRIVNADSALGRMVRINPAYGTELTVSVLNTINARTVSFVQGKILAAAENGGALRLVEINPATLETTKQGTEDIHAGSLLWVNGGDIYAILSGGGTLNLARFDTDLVVQAKSSIAVHPYASVVIQNNRLLTQYADGRAAILDPRTLAELAN